MKTKEKQQLKAKAHPLKPIVLIGNNGLTAAVQNEVDQALAHHELIKVRIATQDRDLKQQAFKEIAEVNRAALIQIIGNIGVFYRKKAAE